MGLTMRDPDEWPEEPDPEDEYYCPYCLATPGEDHDSHCPLVDVPDADGIDEFIDEMEQDDTVIWEEDDDA
jgi:hypothetical protein